MAHHNIARDDAAEMALYFADEIVSQLVDSGEASEDLLNDYPDGDSYHHENHVDRPYTLLEAAQLLDDYSKHVETDYGLWFGLEPREAISCQAAYTYGNAVYAEWQDIIRQINDEFADVDSPTLEQVERFIKDI